VRRCAGVEDPFGRVGTYSVRDFLVTGATVLTTRVWKDQNMPLLTTIQTNDDIL
jgi:hypothetical protein